MTELVDIFVHLDDHLADLFSQYGGWIHAILFAIVFCETGLVVTPFLPGDSLLFAVGTLSATGGFPIGTPFVVLCAAAILGDTVNYWAGSVIGAKAFTGRSRFFRKEYLDRTHRFYERHGGKTIILARFVPIIRTFAPFVAGMGTMNYPRFLIYNVAGGIAWVAIFLFAGYFFGNIELVKKNFTLVILGIVLVSMLPLAVEALKAWRRPAA